MCTIEGVHGGSGFRAHQSPVDRRRSENSTFYRLRVQARNPADCCNAPAVSGGHFLPPIYLFSTYNARHRAATCAGVRGSDFVCFYDWNEGRLVRRIDVGAVKDVIWSDNGELVAIAGDASFYILQVRHRAV